MSVLRIYQNPTVVTALSNLKVIGTVNSKSLESLSSDLRINRAADDAADLSISEKLRAQLQIRANQNQTISTYIASNPASALRVEGILATESRLAQQAVSTIDVAQGRDSDMRSRLGAIQSNTESTTRNLDIASENLVSAESRIRDADIAAETLIMARSQILLQAGIAALAQANQLPQTVLQLLR